MHGRPRSVRRTRRMAPACRVWVPSVAVVVGATSPDRAGDCRGCRRSDAAAGAERGPADGAVIGVGVGVGVGIRVGVAVFVAIRVTVAIGVRVGVSLPVRVVALVVEAVGAGRQRGGEEEGRECSGRGRSDDAAPGAPLLGAVGLTTGRAYRRGGADCGGARRAECGVCLTATQQSRRETGQPSADTPTCAALTSTGATLRPTSPSCAASSPAFREVAARDAVHRRVCAEEALVSAPDSGR